MGRIYQGLGQSFGFKAEPCLEDHGAYRAAVDDIHPAFPLRTLNHGNYGILTVYSFLWIMQLIVLGVSRRLVPLATLFGYNNLVTKSRDRLNPQTLNP